MSAELRSEQTAIPGLLVVRLPVHQDARGWFKEAWQREKMVALGLPDFGPVQANVSYNASRGAVRGLHAEPWDKLVSVATGEAFGAWVDLREGETFGSVVTVTLDASVAVFVPRGVANSYQTLSDGVAYTYLVNDHWRPGVAYPALALDDPTCAIDWPIALAECEVSEKDLANPELGQVAPVARRRPLILGADGQLGTALRREFPAAHAVGRAELDLADVGQLEDWAWRDYDVVLNAAAYTRVDEAETPEGRLVCWAANALAPAHLARLSARFGFQLVHYSTDYVYDGAEAVHEETESPAPLQVYGQAKAAGDLAVLAGAPGALVVRTSWVVGDGANFLRTMLRLARDGVSPGVVDDQVGRLSFTDELARATRHLLEREETGVVHVSNGGEPATWCAIARRVFAVVGRDPGDVAAVSTADYAAGRELAPRPASSLFSLARLQDAGWQPGDQWTGIDDYVERATSAGS